MDDAEGEDLSVDQRETRRRARRSLRDEVDALAQPTEGEQAVEASGSNGEVDEAEECCLAKERKRKWKHVATLQPKRSKRISTVRDVEMPIPLQLRFPSPRSESVATLIGSLSLRRQTSKRRSSTLRRMRSG